MITQNFAALTFTVFLSAILTIGALAGVAMADPMVPEHGVSSVMPAISRDIVQKFTSKPPSGDTASLTSYRARRLVIFFHGIRGRGTQMNAIGESWGSVLPDTAFAFPDAPFTNSSRGHQWFVVDDKALRPDRIQAARRAFDDLVIGIVKREGFESDLKNVAFVGVSQGAIVALDAVTTGRWKVGALVTFAGLLPLPPTSPSTDTPILLMHGAADKTIPPAASIMAERQLKSAGYDVTLRVFPDVAHTITQGEAREAGAFLSKHLVP